MTLQGFLCEGGGVQIPLGAWLFSEWVVQGGEKRLGGGLGRLGIISLTFIHLDFTPLA